MRLLLDAIEKDNRAGGANCFGKIHLHRSGGNLALLGTGPAVEASELISTGAYCDPASLDGRALSLVTAISAAAQGAGFAAACAAVDSASRAASMRANSTMAAENAIRTPTRP